MSNMYLLRSWIRRLGYDVVRAKPASSLSGHLELLFSQLGINCVLDVGANVGQYGQFLRQNGYHGYIVSFEPVAATYAQLQRTVAPDPRWSAHNFALGSSSGSTKINVLHSSAHSSLLSPSETSLREHGRGIALDHEEKIQISKLDDVLLDCIAHIPDPRIYLKMDTQGWDLEVLRGAANSLKSIPALQTEASIKPMYEGMPSFLESITYLNQMDFEITGFFSVAHDQQLRLLEMDCVMRRASGRVSDGAV